MKKFLPALFLSACLPLTAAASTLYKCTDGSGVVLYTNQKTARRDCVILSQTPSASTADPSRTYGNYGIGAGSSGTGSRPKASSTPTPGDFPRVSSSEQKARDTDRRAILEKEMMNEQQNLDRARKALGESAGQPADKLKVIRDTIALHERNVEALKKELGNLR